MAGGSTGEEKEMAEMDRNGSDCACRDNDNSSFSKILELTSRDDRNSFVSVTLIILTQEELTL